MKASALVPALVMAAIIVATFYFLLQGVYEHAHNLTLLP